MLTGMSEDANMKADKERMCAMNRIFNSRFWRAMDFLATMFLINCLWLIGCLPVVTAGASTAALCHAWFRIYDRREEPMYRMFRNGFLSNLKQATAVWVVYLFLILDIGLVVWSKRQYGALPVWASAKPVIALAAVVVLFAVFTAEYIFAVIAYYDCSTRQAVIDAMGLAFRYPQWTVLLLAMDAAAAVLVYFAPFLALIAPAACGAIRCRITRKLFLLQEQTARDDG